MLIRSPRPLVRFRDLGFVVIPAENENRHRRKTKPMRILIVEEDLALANFIRKGLEAGHSAVDGGEPSRAGSVDGAAA